VPLNKDVGNVANRATDNFNVTEIKVKLILRKEKIVSIRKIDLPKKVKPRLQIFRKSFVWSTDNVDTTRTSVEMCSGHSLQIISSINLVTTGYKISNKEDFLTTD